MSKGSSLHFLLVAAVLAGLAGCGVVASDDPRDPIQESDLFLPTVDSDTGATTWTFQTNDPAYWTSGGYTLWARNGTSHPVGESWDRTFVLTKESGDEAAGYGVLFGYAPGPTMLVAMVNLLGQYCVGELTEGGFQFVASWTASAHLNATAGVPDTVRLTYDGTAYRMYLGSSSDPAWTYADVVEPYHDGGEEGFLVVISYEDRFPQTPVRVVFAVP